MSRIIIFLLLSFLLYVYSWSFSTKILSIIQIESFYRLLIEIRLLSLGPIRIDWSNSLLNLFKTTILINTCNVFLHFILCCLFLVLCCSYSFCFAPLVRFILATFFYFTSCLLLIVGVNNSFNWSSFCIYLSWYCMESFLVLSMWVQRSIILLLRSNWRYFENRCPFRKYNRRSITTFHIFYFYWRYFLLAFTMIFLVFILLRPIWSRFAFTTGLLQSNCFHSLILFRFTPCFICFFLFLWLFFLAL